MKQNIVVSIIIALFFSMLWILKYQWSFNLWVSNFVWYDDTFNVDFSFLKISANYTFYLTDLLYNSYRDLLKENITKFFLIENQEIYTLVVFSFFFLVSIISSLILKLLPVQRDKIYFVIWLITFYYVLVWILKNVL